MRSPLSCRPSRESPRSMLVAPNRGMTICTTWQSSEGSSPRSVSWSLLTAAPLETQSSSVGPWGGCTQDARAHLRSATRRTWRKKAIGKKVQVAVPCVLCRHVALLRHHVSCPDNLWIRRASIIGTKCRIGDRSAQCVTTSHCVNSAQSMSSAQNVASAQNLASARYTTSTQGPEWSNSRRCASVCRTLA